MAGKSTSTGKKAMAAGVGDSKVFAKEDPDHGYDWSQYTINGQSIPEDLWANMRYSLTDQGHEELAAGPRPVTRVTRDAADKRVDRFRDGRKTGHLILGEDPLKAAMEENLPPGHSGLWMGAEMCRQDGLVRGVLKFEPVLVPDGKGGTQRVEQGGMFLASVPQELKDEADDYYQQLNRQKQVSVVEQVRQQSDQVMHEGGLRDVAKRKRVLDDLAGVQVEDQELGDADMLAHVSE